MQAWRHKETKRHGYSLESDVIVYGLCLYCVAASGCVGELSTGVGEVCDNAVDDDGDFVVDCADTDCFGVTPCGWDVDGSGSPGSGTAGCGHAGESCCTGSICDTGLTCLNNLCVESQQTCGGEQQVCCPGDMCNAGLYCSDHRCFLERTDCGGHQQPCCEGADCDPSLVCLRGTCTPCGEQMQICCESAQCEYGLTCEDERCVTSECGGEREPCCAGGECGPSLICDGGVCDPCGREGQVCCASGCNSGLTCERNHCVDPDRGDDEGSPNTCHLHDDCASCIAATGCGWCDTTDTCMAGGFEGPDSGSCSWLDWDYVDCPAESGACSILGDCLSCLEEDGCGWCSATSTCMPGDFTGPSTGDCGWFDWDFLDC